MRIISLFSAIIVLLALATPADAAKWNYVANGKWQVDYGEDQCRAAREFVDGHRSVVLIFSRPESRDEMNLQLVGDIPRISAQNRDMRVTFLPNGGTTKEMYYVGKTDGGRQSLMFGTGVGLYNFDDGSADKFITIGGRLRSKPEFHDAITAMDIHIEGIGVLNFATGPMGSVLKVLEDCTDNLAQHWGFDISTERSLTKRPDALNDLTRWLIADDYPVRQRNDGGVAIVDFRLNVEADGHVSDCFIVGYAGEEDFARVVCDRIKERAKLSPALDKDGNPVRSFFINRVKFTLRRN